MELITHAFVKPIFTFLAIFALAAVGWALSDLAARRLSGREHTLWALAILVFPPMGAIIYGRVGKKDPSDAEIG